MDLNNIMHFITCLKSVASYLKGRGARMSQMGSTVRSPFAIYHFISRSVLCTNLSTFCWVNSESAFRTFQHLFPLFRLCFSAYHGGCCSAWRQWMVFWVPTGQRSSCASHAEWWLLCDKEQPSKQTPLSTKTVECWPKSIWSCPNYHPLLFLFPILNKKNRYIGIINWHFAHVNGKTYWIETLYTEAKLRFKNTCDKKMR